MILQKKNKILILVVIILVSICIGPLLMRKLNEGFQDSGDMVNVSNSNDVVEETLLRKYNNDLKSKSSDELIDLASRLRLRLDSYGLFPDGSSPDLSKYVSKSELQPDMGRCSVDKAIDKDIAPAPKITKS